MFRKLSVITKAQNAQFDDCQALKVPETPIVTSTGHLSPGVKPVFMELAKVKSESHSDQKTSKLMVNKSKCNAQSNEQPPAQILSSTALVLPKMDTSLLTKKTQFSSSSTMMRVEGLSQGSKLSSATSSQCSSKRDSFRNKLRGSLMSKQCFAEEKGIDQITIVKLTNQNSSDIIREESMFRSPFHILYDQSEFLGEGCAACVYKCVEKKSGAIRAVKQVRTDDEEKLQAARDEYDIQKDLKHPNIIETYNIFFDHIRSTLYTVMEYIEGQSLQECIYANGPLTEQQSKSVIRQILEAIKYLHDKGICHRDIKPDNIMLTKTESTYKVKIGDFNVAKKFQDRVMMTKTGVEEWIAPEVIAGQPYDEKIDMWGAGCSFYYMLTGIKPFENPNIAKLHQQIQKGEVDFGNEQCSKLSQECKSFILKLIETDPELRIKASQALEDDWLLENKASEPSPNIKYSASAQIPVYKHFMDPLILQHKNPNFFYDSPQPKIIITRQAQRRCKPLERKNLKPEDDQEIYRFASNLSLKNQANSSHAADSIHRIIVDNIQEDLSPSILKLRQIKSFMDADIKDDFRDSQSHIIKSKFANRMKHDDFSQLKKESELNALLLC